MTLHLVRGFLFPGLEETLVVKQEIGRAVQRHLAQYRGTITDSTACTTPLGTSMSAVETTA